MEPRAVPARESLAPLAVRTYRATPIVALALLAAVLAMLLVFAVAPGAPGFCET